MRTSRRRENRRKTNSKELVKDPKNDFLGEYIEVTEEKFFQYTTKESHVVVHFYHKDF